MGSDPPGLAKVVRPKVLTFGLRFLVFRLWLGPRDHDPMGQGLVDHGPLGSRLWPDPMGQGPINFEAI